MNLSVKKIEITCLKENISSLLEKLQDGGYLEVISEDEKEVSNSSKGEYHLRLSEVSFAISFLENFKPKENFAKNLIFSFVPLKEEVKEEELLELSSSVKIKEVVLNCGSIEEKINKLDARKEELLNEINVLKRFSKTSVFLKNDLKEVNYFTGTIQSKDKDSFLDDINKEKVSYIEEGRVDDFSYNFVLFYQKEDKEHFSSILKRHGSKEEVVFWKEKPNKALEKREKELKEVNLEKDIQEKEAQKLLYFLPKLEALHDWLSWQIDKEESLEKSQQTEKCAVIKAWTAQEDIKKVTEELKKETENFMIKELSVKEEENPPVIIKNQGVGGSFGVVTGVYGLPKKDEIDPTPYLAPFFIFYFALALSDSGYGILLALLAFVAKKMFKKAKADNFFNLFIFSGILTSVVGLFVGTVFGSEALGFLRFADPLGDPITALLFVLALGVFQIFVGLVIGMVWLIKNGKFNEAIAGNGASIVFFIGVILFLLTGNMNFIISGVISMGVLAFMYSTGGGIVQRLGGAFGALYGLMGYVGDILSYSRILALGLATGIIAAVINMIAVIFIDMIPVQGLNLAIAGVVLVVGHIGNLLINALGAFIHAARLQFVEFFSKFMEGGGRYFKPLAKNGRYIRVIN